MQLENYFVEELSFQVRQDYQPDSENPSKLSPSDLEIEVRLGKIKEDAFKQMCHLTITLKEKLEKGLPYDFKLVIVGFFQIHSSCSEDEVEMLLKNSAPSMLFTAGRELLMLVTGRARFAPLMLPTMTFLPKLGASKASSTKSLNPKAKPHKGHITNVAKMTTKKA